MATHSAKRVLITGGAGFIGSHLVDTLMTNGLNVCVLDNLSTGKLENIKKWRKHKKLTFLNWDLLNISDLSRKLQSRYETIFHLAANPEVRVGSTNPDLHFQQNVIATQELLEYVRKTQDDHTLVFASTSTVYGEPSRIPTLEDYSPLSPISVYGATKLASEALITAYASTYGFKAIIYRLANIIGPRSQHGVIHDFIQKLKNNPKKLEILGDGTQNKSYLYITDCIKAILLGLEKPTGPLEVYNIGSEDQINVKEIAKAVIEEMKLKNVKLVYAGGIEGGRGWKGDVKNMLLDIGKLKSKGWKPQYNSMQAVKKTAKQLMAEREPSRD